jgi:hypothetical protein
MIRDYEIMICLAAVWSLYLGYWIRKLRYELAEKRLVATDPRFWGASLHSSNCTYCKRKKVPLDYWSRTKRPKSLRSWLEAVEAILLDTGDPTRAARFRRLLARSKICPKCKTVTPKGAYPRTREGSIHKAETVKTNAEIYRMNRFLLDGIGNEALLMDGETLSQLEAVNRMNELAAHLIRSSLEEHTQEESS